MWIYPSGRGAELLQVTGKTITNPELYKKIKDLTTKAIHSIEIPNFNKTGLEIIAKGYKGIPELLKIEKLQHLGVIFVKGAEDTVAVIYKGVVIASGKAKIVALQLKSALKKFRGKQLEDYLDELVELAGMAENLATTKNVDLFLASATRLESLNITAKTAMQYLDEALVHFNYQVIDDLVIQIGDKNCVYVVEAVEEYLRTGKIIKVIPSDVQSIYSLASKYKGTFLTKTIPQIGDLMKDGERGIIYGVRNPANKSHVFNVIKINGTLKMVGGQSGLPAVIRQSGYTEFKYLKTY